MPHGCQFNDLWLGVPEYKPWIKRNEKDPCVADCKICRVSISLKTMGKTALSSHMKGKKHMERLKYHSNTKDSSLTFFFDKKESTSSSTSKSPSPRVTSSVEACARPSSSSVSALSLPKFNSASTSDQMKQFVSKSDTLKAEIWWCVRSAVRNHSFSSNSDLSFILNKMFPDIPAVNALQLGETKSMYLTVYGLAPHLKSILLQDLRSEPFSVLFDESLNKSTMSKQLDIHVRYWSNFSVKTRYVTSFMLGHATADDLVSHLNSLNEDLNFGNLLQMSMDGPNVNWSAFEKFGKQLEVDYGRRLLNIGSCGLHQVHNSYRAAVNETSWNMDKFLSCLYTLFKDVPARRADFTDHTGSTVFPLKFAAHRWVENHRVLLRAKQMLPFLQKYISGVQSKHVKDPKTYSYSSVVEFLNDKLLPAKLSFLIYLCKPVECFLTVYQQDTPLVPFLYQDLNDLLEKVMKKFVKPTVTEAKEVHDIDVTKSDNIVNNAKIKIGVEAEEILKQQQLTQREILLFRTQCQSFLQTFVSRLQKKSPLQYKFTKYIQCLSPSLISSSPETAKRYMKSALLHIKDLHIVPVEHIDDILEDFDALCCHAKKNESFKSFDHRSMSVDKFFHEICSNNSTYSHLWPMIRTMLVLSHGQASVERGFSCNKEILETNMQQESLVAKRIVKDFIRSIGGLEKFDISPELLKSCSLAYSRYHSALAMKREKKEEGRGEKRKAIEENISDLKKRKVVLQETAKALEDESDKKGDAAESEKSIKTQVVLFTQANALRKAAKEKKAEVEEIEKTLGEKVSLLKNL